MDYLVQIKGRWHYRRRVPAALREYFPNHEIKRALGTSLRREAQAVAAGLHTEVERLFLCLRMKMLSDAQIDEMVANFLRSSLKKTEDRRASKPSAENREWAQYRVPEDDLPGKPPRGVRRKSQAMTLCAQGLQDMLATGDVTDYQPLRDAARQQLQAAGLEVPEGGPTFRKLLRGLAKAQVDALQVESARCCGDYDSEIERRILSKYMEVPQSVVPTPLVDMAQLVDDIVQRVSAKITPPKCSVTLGEAAARCLDYLATSGNGGRGLAPSSLKKYKDQFPLLIGLLGGPERPLGDIEPLELLDVRKKLLRFPARWKTGRYRHLSLPEVLQANIPEGHCLTKRTVNAYLSRLSALFEFAALPAVGWLSKNIARGLTLALNEVEEAAAKQVPFTLEELKHLFEIVPVTKRRPHEAWLPLLAAYTGCSLAELAQLRTSDVEEIDGLPCLNILTLDHARSADDERRVKRPSRRRRVPLHTHLVEVGFLRWAENVRAAGRKDLFPSIAKEGDARTNYGAQSFRRLREKVCAQPERTSFHALRHTVQDHLKLARNVRDDFYHALVGHRPRHATDNIYTSPHRVRQLYAEAVSLIDYGLNIGAIKRRYSKLL